MCQDAGKREPLAHTDLGHGVWLDRQPRVNMDHLVCSPWRHIDHLGYKGCIVLLGCIGPTSSKHQRAKWMIKKSELLFN